MGGLQLEWFFVVLSATRGHREERDDDFASGITRQTNNFPRVPVLYIYIYMYINMSMYSVLNKNGTHYNDVAYIYI